MIAEPLSRREVRPHRMSFPRALWRLLVRWRGRRRQRLDLAELDEHLLADIGVTPREARRESARPFWR